MLKTLQIFCLIVLVSCALVAVARGEYRDPTIQVNVNEQTSLFEDSLEGADQDWGSLQEKLEQGKRTALSDIESKKNLKSITSKSEGELKNSAASLSSIDAIDLNSRGSEEFAKGTLMQDIYVDFSKPLNQQSMKDAKKIGKAQDKLMGNLLGKLKEIGVDCKTVKGPKQMEPAYYLQLEKSQHKDTKYNQKFCEELRSKYNCTDSLGLKCMKRGMKWEKWERKEFLLDGRWVYAAMRGWVYGEKMRKKKFTCFIRHGGHGNPNASIRAYIASQLKLDLQQIREDIHVHIRGEGHEHWVGSKVCIRDKFRVVYFVRDGHEICTEWKENWTERCRIE